MRSIYSGMLGISIVALGACASAPEGALEQVESQAAGPQVQERSDYYPAVLDLIGIPPLVEVPMPRGAREIRLSVEELTTPSAFVQISQENDTVRGVIVLWWEKPYEGRSDYLPVADGWYDRLGGGRSCRTAQTGTDWRDIYPPEMNPSRDWVVACRVPTEQVSVDWDAAVSQLDSLGLSRIQGRPRLGTLDDINPMMSHPTFVRGQILEGAEFGRFSWDNPEIHGGEDAAMASELKRWVQGLVALVVDSAGSSG